MPFLIVHTNAKLKDNNPEQFVEDAANLVAQELHKPISYVVASYDYNAAMSFGGSAQKHGALVEMKSIGFGDKQDCIRAAKGLYGVLESFHRIFVGF